LATAVELTNAAFATPPANNPHAAIKPANNNLIFLPLQTLLEHGKT
jgi:hypothetical protein